jgi:hypothetical protein
VKSERRHELQHNQLADALGTGMDRFAPYIKWIALAVLVAVVFVASRAILQGQKERLQSRAAVDLLFALDSPGEDAFRVVASDYGDTPAGHWAMAARGDENFARGLDDYFTDRDAADSAFRTAVEAYQSCLDRSKIPLLRSRVQLALAKAYEAQGDIEKARTQYDVAAKDAIGEEIRSFAVRRQQMLGKTETADFIRWLGEQKIAPPPPTTLPTDLNSLPDAPSGAMPPVSPSTTLPTIPPALPSGNSPTTPPADAPPADAPPADAPPADAPPADAPSTDGAVTAPKSE